jgi:CBS domain-containing protein
MATVRDLLRIKGNQVWSVGPEATVLEALEIMADKNVGALVVLENEQLRGIISERDFVRAIAKNGNCLIDAPVKEYMTREVYSAGLDLNTDECMTLMSARHIRHLPVMVEGKLAGLISIGDVVKEVVSSKELTIQSLENYISGTGYNQ